MNWILKLTEFWVVWGGITFATILLFAIGLREVTELSILLTTALASAIGFITVGGYVIRRVSTEEDFTVPEKLEWLEYEEPEETFW